MTAPNFAYFLSATLAGGSGTIAVGDCLVPTGAGYVIATTGNRGTLRSHGLSLTATSADGGTVQLQSHGTISATVSGLASGSASWVRVSAGGRLERCTPSGSDDVCGYAEADGSVHLAFGFLTASIANGGGGSVPTGTGFRHVTSGAEDAAATAVNLASADVTGTLNTGKGGTGATSFNANEVVIGGSTLTTAANVKAGSGFVSAGATPAASGAFRVPNGSTNGVVARNAANSGDVSLVALSGADVCVVNDAGANTTAYTYVNATTKIQFNIGINSAPEVLGIYTDRVVLSQPIEIAAGSSRITTGAGAPSAADPNGSLYLRTNGTSSTGIYTRQGGAWSAVGGGGSPGGSNTQVQFNDSSAFGGDADLTWDKTNNVLTATGAVAVGAAPSVVGSMRLDGAADRRWLTFKYADTTDYDLCQLVSTTVRWGNSTFIQRVTGSGVELYAPGGTVQVFNAAGTDYTITSGANLTLHGSGTTYGGGVKVTLVTNATTVPTTNPTGGSLLYADTGALKARGSSGTVTTIAPADPHCPRCGRDFAIEHKNDAAGDHLAICIPCMLDALMSAGIDPSKFTMVDQRTSTKTTWDGIAAEAAQREADYQAQLAAEQAAKAAAAEPTP